MLKKGKKVNSNFFSIGSNNVWQNRLRCGLQKSKFFIVNIERQAVVRTIDILQLIKAKISD